MAWDSHDTSAKRDKDGRIVRNHVTARDVCELLARAMRIWGIRPEEFYTDNGSEFIPLESMLPKLADDPPIRFVRSRPRMPWGRGKVENGLGQVTPLLRRIARGYRPKKDRPSIDIARKSAELSIGDRTGGFCRRISLILAITSNAEGVEPALVKQLKKRDDIRPNLLPLTLPYITATEFTYIFARLIRRNLNATFDQSLNGQEQAKIAKHWHDITNGNWYLLRAGAKYIDEELGASQSTEPRRITDEVLARAEQHFQRARE